MLESILNLINSSGIKVLEIYPEESESESQERDLNKKDQTNGTHLFNTLTFNHSPTDSLKKLKSQLDLHSIFKYFTHYLL